MADDIRLTSGFSLFGLASHPLMLSVLWCWLHLLPSWAEVAVDGVMVGEVLGTSRHPPSEQPFVTSGCSGGSEMPGTGGKLLLVE